MSKFVYLDACIVIYLLEECGEFSRRARAFLAQNEDAILCISPLVRLEVLAKPLKTNNAQLVEDCETFFAAQRWLSVDDKAFELALQLRSKHGLKTPDALHLAIATLHGCAEFWTNDHRLQGAVQTINRNILQDAHQSA